MLIQIENGCQGEHSFTFGIGLNEFFAFTTNEKWEKSFIDRTIPKNFNEAIRKSMTIKGLSIFFLPGKGQSELEGIPLISKENYILRPSTNYIK